MKQILGYILMILLCIVFGFFCWKAERWINWKFSYGKRVETRLQELEKRVDLLEIK